MQQTELDSLRAWATALAPTGLVQARQVLGLLALLERTEGRFKRTSERFWKMAAIVKQIHNERAEKQGS